MTVMPPGLGGPANDQAVPPHHDAAVNADRRGLAARGEAFARRLIGRFRRSPALTAVGSFAAAIGVAAITAVTVQAVVPEHPPAASGTASAGSFRLHPVFITLPVRPASYLGVYADGVPRSYAPIESFAAATGVRPNIALYYSGWYEPFRSAFAVQAAGHGAVPFIQIDPAGSASRAIAAGALRHLPEVLCQRRGQLRRQDGPWRHRRLRPRDERLLVPWGIWHTSPAVCRGRLAARRHRVPAAGCRRRDLAVDGQHHRHSAGRSLPGPLVARQLVCDLGRDRRLLLKPSWTFASLFGPTIRVRARADT